jgi:hypothetical protein
MQYGNKIVSISKDYKIGIFLGLLAVAVNVGLYGALCYKDHQKKLFNEKLLSVCAFEVKTSLNKPDSGKFNLDESYTLETNNPSIWLVNIKVTAENQQKETLTKRANCRVYKVNGNLQVDNWGLSD